MLLISKNWQVLLSIFKKLTQFFLILLNFLKFSREKVYLIFQDFKSSVCSSILSGKMQTNKLYFSHLIQADPINLSFYSKKLELSLCTQTVLFLKNTNLLWLKILPFSSLKLINVNISSKMFLLNSNSEAQSSTLLFQELKELEKQVLQNICVLIMDSNILNMKHTFQLSSKNWWGEKKAKKSHSLK